MTYISYFTFTTYNTPPATQIQHIITLKTHRFKTQSGRSTSVQIQHRQDTHDGTQHTSCMHYHTPHHYTQVEFITRANIAQYMTVQYKKQTREHTTCIPCRAKVDQTTTNQPHIHIDMHTSAYLKILRTLLILSVAIQMSDTTQGCPSAARQTTGQITLCTEGWTCPHEALMIGQARVLRRCVGSR